MLIQPAIATLLVVLTVQPVFALESFLLKETAGADEIVDAPCALAGNTNGTAANYRWYNVCSGYVWAFSAWTSGEAVGVRFGGVSQPAVNPANIVKRAITYYLNVVPGYNQTVDVYLDSDTNGDGCPDANIASDLNIDPGLRWNCSEFNNPVPPGVNSVIVRQVHHGGAAPTFVTDGRFGEACDPVGVPASFYYGINVAACLPWNGPTSRADNFLTWLVLDEAVQCEACQTQVVDPSLPRLAASGVGSSGFLIADDHKHNSSPPKWDVVGQPADFDLFFRPVLEWIGKPCPDNPAKDILCGVKIRIDCRWSLWSNGPWSGNGTEANGNESTGDELHIFWPQGEPHYLLNPAEVKDDRGNTLVPPSDPNINQGDYQPTHNALRIYNVPESLPTIDGARAVVGIDRFEHFDLQFCYNVRPGVPCQPLPKLIVLAKYVHTYDGDFHFAVAPGASIGLSYPWSVSGGIQVNWANDHVWEEWASQIELTPPENFVRDAACCEGQSGKGWMAESDPVVTVLTPPTTSIGDSLAIEITMQDPDTLGVALLLIREADGLTVLFETADLSGVDTTLIVVLETPSTVSDSLYVDVTVADRLGALWSGRHGIMVLDPIVHAPEDTMPPEILSIEPGAGGSTVGCDTLMTGMFAENDTLSHVFYLFASVDTAFAIQAGGSTYAAVVPDSSCLPDGIYDVMVHAVDRAGLTDTAYVESVVVYQATGVADGVAPGAAAAWGVTGTTVVRYRLSAAGDVGVVIYDSQGRIIRNLDQGRQLSGEHLVVWDGQDGGGRRVASGIYFFAVEVGGSRQVGRLVVVR